MPSRVSGRVSGRASRTSSAAVSRKSSAQNLRSRGSTASRISSPQITIPDEGPNSTLRGHISTIFSEAQKTTATHRKLVINLRKIQEACCYEPVKSGKKDSDEEFDEEQFNEEVSRCVVRLMAVKKSEGVGDRVVRFLGLFLRHASDKDNAIFSQMGNVDDDAFPETPTTRLTTQIINLLLSLLSSKEKTVRYRATQVISHIVNSLDSIDDDVFQLLRLGLLKRVRDKESMIRVQAVLGLGRLAGNEGEGDGENDDSDDEDGNLLMKLLEVLQNDPSADVRRSLLLNLPITPGTLPYLLERARDLDPPTRRALYSRLLPALGDFRHLSLSMREKLLRWGLRDRDENVRKAASKLFRERWIEDCAGTREGQENTDGKELNNPTIDGLLELLERIDIVNSGAEKGVALEAMMGFWDGRPDYRDSMIFDDEFWGNLTAESAFLVRSYNDFCRQQGDGKFESMVEEKMPEVTKLAFYIQNYINKLMESIRDEEGQAEAGDEAVDREFIVEQLLHIALTLDYTDEMGRRKMFSLLRETMAFAELPEEITKLVVDILRGICGHDTAGEREFCGLVLEAIAEVHDTIVSDEEAEDSFHSARSEVSEEVAAKSTRKGNRAETPEEEDEEKAIREIVVNMKCLHIAQCMLQNVECNLQQNIHLVTMLNNLVVPAVRSHEAPIRERGLLCLGLCCLLDKTLAEENLTLFLHCFSKGHEALQITALQIISDMLTTHPSLLLGSQTAESSKDVQKHIQKMFTKALKSPAPEVQAASCVALSKLMLGNVVKDEDLLKQIVVAYFDPETHDNAALRQALSYFFPVYCHSRKENMERMAGIAVGAVHTLIGMDEELDEEEEMVAMNIIGAHIVDWTDPRKLVILESSGSDGAMWDELGRKESAKAINGDVHLSLAGSLLTKIVATNCGREEKKVYISMLGKLYITASSDAEKLREVYGLVEEAVEEKVASDATSRNALNKVKAALEKAIGANSADKENDVATVVDDGMTAMEDETTVMGAPSTKADKDAVEEEDLTVEVAGPSTRDSLLDELLDDEDEL